ncbi:ChrR family anti-sigma-E factor [Anianabacter salinae]|uniref:ChrR family anti-sigma-E factor n=1 Tax=Anianabacter salinae TaxID=2851023 RepID=UPI00225E15A6|nr:ChrR family anti-sigma-E factor [Anianabacter salinae]MBV0913336.1 ChrR family anti-sigma-E factor [Anianabacter salinae]
MTIRHHLSNELIWAYSVGELPEAFDLVIATHVSMCDECRARLESLNALGGAVLEHVELADMDEDALHRTLARTQGVGDIRGRGKDAIRADLPGTPVLPQPLRDYVGGDLAQVAWRPVGGGVRQAILPTAKGATARLLSIPAGAAVPDHGHRGTELTLVLQGAFADETDRFGPGDVEIADEDLEHSPVAEAGETCICLAATDAPLRFSSFLPRLAQPFLRI